MAAQNHEWTTGVPASRGASGGDNHKADGQEDIAFTVAARQDIANTTDGNTYNFGLTLERDNPPDGGVDNCTDLDFNAVAPDTDRGVEYDLDGESAGDAASFRATFPA